MGARGPANPRWKGEAATDQTKRKRAQKLFGIKGRTCEHDDCDKDAEHRHHINGDPGDNQQANIGFYCARHHLLIHHPPEPPKECSNCGGPAKPSRGGMCPACYAYQKRTGKPRPWRVDGRKEGATAAVGRRNARPPDPPTPCSNCGELTRPSWRGRCRRCYDYWRYHDAERPYQHDHAPGP